jgi:biopolymer transport protein TolR
MSHNKSPRVKRHERLQKRIKGQANLSLTSLMDIFTILVFFLLVNSQNPAKLPDITQLQLPVSTAEKDPKEQLIVMITKKDILVQDMQIATVAEAMANKTDNIAALGAELRFRAAKTIAPLNEQGIPERDITILSDKDTPYSVIRKVMATCSQNDFAKISFAVARGGKKS